MENLNCSPNNQSFRQLVEGLHAIMCKLDHDTGDCAFHEETITEDTWNRESHQKWSEYAKSLIINSGNSPEKILEELRTVTNVIENVQAISSAGKAMLNDLIDCTPSLSTDRTLSTLLRNQHEGTS